MAICLKLTSRLGRLQPTYRLSSRDVLQRGCSGFQSRPPDSGVTLHSPEAKDVLRRTRVVESEQEASQIVGQLIARGEPIGVDMEGVTNLTGSKIKSSTSLIQIADSSANIYLFRTGINSALLHHGRLKDLLETPYVLKVMHASSVDCMSIYADGVKMGGLYDTAAAHKVLEYQLSGRSIHTANTIGLNGLCTYCGFETNPLKDRFKDYLWKQVVYGNVLSKKENLPDEIILYCGYDVEHLLNIYKTLRDLIDRDFRPLVDAMTELEIIRAIDPDLAKRKRLQLKSVEQSSVFVSNLSDQFTKADMYALLAGRDGNRHVYHSGYNRTAAILLDSREDALQLYKRWSESLPIDFGSDASVKLVVDTHPTEVGEQILAEDKLADRNDSWISDPRGCAQIVDLLLAAEMPVVLDIHKFPKVLSIELYTGVPPPLNIALTKEMLTEGKLGDLLSSPTICKILMRTDTNTTYSLMKMLMEHQVRLTNWFDLTAGFKVLEYARHGQSLFKSESKSIQAICSRLGVPIDATGQVTKLDWFYDAYLVLTRLLTPQLMALVAEKCETDASIGTAVNSAAAKKSRKEFRAALEANTVHVSLINQDQGHRNVKDALAEIEKFTKSNNFPVKRIIETDSTILVELNSPQSAKAVVLHFENEPNGLRVVLPDFVKEAECETPYVDYSRIVAQKEANLKVLADMGVLKAIERNNPARATARLRSLLMTMSS